MVILLNGTTGLLGSNLLFEILKQNIGCLDELEIVILGKSKEYDPINKRMSRIFQSYGIDYFGLEFEGDHLIYNLMMSRITLIDCDLRLNDLGMSPESISYLSNLNIDIFFHVAALNNYTNTALVEEMLKLVNYEGTKRIMNLVKQLKVGRFVFISTVYSSGAGRWTFEPGFINQTGVFRNPYEKSKLDAELYIMEFAQKENIDYKIIRTSTLGGRLIEKETGSTCKFDVFYQWAAFLLKQKLYGLKAIENIYTKPMAIDLRIAMHPDSTLNICPVDYAARMIYLIATSDSKDVSFHVVNDVDIPTRTVVKIICRTMNIYNYSIVDEEPPDKNLLEEKYYRSVGKIFTPYILDPPLNYVTSNLEEIKSAGRVSCPLMDDDNFQKLIDYAKRYYFGIDVS